MSDDDALQPPPFRAKQVIDPEIESTASQSIVQMMFDYEVSCIAHIIFSNYTWEQRDVQPLIVYYRRLPKETTAKFTEIQHSCASEKFATLMKKHALMNLPIYGKSIDAAAIDPNSTSRVYHEPRQYLGSGSATAAELHTFVFEVMCEALQPIFPAKEIRKVLSTLDLMRKLEQCSAPSDEIANNDQEMDFEIMNTLRLHKCSFPNFYAKLSGSIIGFMVYFALHTIRHHCHVSFGVDGELKFYVREMYKKALEDNRNIRLKAPPGGSGARGANGMKVTVKLEKKNDSDDDCEIIEPIGKKANSTTGSVEKANGSSHFEKDFPEREMLEQLDHDNLPMNFKSKFRKLVEQNQHLRDEINDVKAMIQLNISEKKKRLG